MEQAPHPTQDGRTYYVRHSSNAAATKPWQVRKLRPGQADKLVLSLTSECEARALALALARMRAYDTLK